MTTRPLLVLVLLLTALGCQTAPVPSSAGMGTLQITAVAGPVCPVEQIPPTRAVLPVPSPARPSSCSPAMAVTSSSRRW